MKHVNWMSALCAVCGIILAGTAAAVETYWELDGNAAAGWLGTTNVNPLTLKVNNTVGWRLLKSTGTPNVVGGYSGNTVSAVEGAAVGGGGYGTYSNRVTGAFGTVSGGVNNSSGDRAAIGGGTSNTASGIRSAIGGGYNNVASGSYAAVGGGWANQATAAYATVSGGGPGDLLSTGTSNNRAVDEYCTVGGGAANLAGSPDQVTTNAQFATISGGKENVANGPYSVVGGGGQNTATGAYSVVSGGGPSSVLYFNWASDDFGAIGGGGGNTAGNGDGILSNSTFATVAGGERNTARDAHTSIAGGQGNTASGQSSFIGGGYLNSTYDNYCVVGGGDNNSAGLSDQYTNFGYGATVAGGSHNAAAYTYAAIGGGEQNMASGHAATVPGGYQNVASDAYSFAAGCQAQATAGGAFAWADVSWHVFTVNVMNRFGARASGGFYFYTNADSTAGAYMAAGAGTWTNMSDRESKENFQQVDAESVLRKVVEMPITTWNYRSEGSKVRHLGPMAQDVYAAFALGDSDKGITTIDADGIALAAIQGLTQRLGRQDSKIEMLQAHLRSSEAANTALEERLARMESENKELKDVKSRLAALETMIATIPTTQLAAAK